jgi:uncharacterized membrane protein
MIADEPDRLERLVGRVLRVGGITSTVVLAVGLLLSLAWPSAPAAGTVLRAGLIILIATPVARVIASVAQYTAERDWLFASLTLAVLAVLLGSLLIGVSG